MVFPLGDSEKTRIVPVVTYALIALNVAMYLLQLDRGETFTDSLAATPYEISHNYDLELPRDEALLRLPAQAEPIAQTRVPFPVRLTVLSAMFLHSDPLHLAMNMLFLWIFGDNVEEVFGSVWYCLFYLACGLVGTMAQVAAAPNSVIPSLGASGAIAGVMGAYVVWFPRNRVRVLVLRFLVEVPALIVIGAWFVFQVWRGVGSIREHND
ncbi:MAG TPA: rhomboid family intramembrane serine protease, partial [Isosphaeraceae bacterium]|nr:rhomboid family intramembrane serine protease [Isosphaeraceae bacterium]